MDIHPINESDLIAVARIHLQAFPDSALTKLGIETIQRYYSWQLNVPEGSLCIGAYDNTIMAGFCFAGSYRDAEIGFFRKNGIFLIWQMLTHPGLLTQEIVRNRVNYSIQALRQFAKKKKKQKKVIKPPNRRFGILSIAVNPKYQGSGVGKLLMRDVEMAARRDNFDSMRLSVHPDNKQAILFYEKLGWQKVPSADGIWIGLMTKNIRNEI